MHNSSNSATNSKNKSKKSKSETEKISTSSTIKEDGDVLIDYFNIDVKLKDVETQFYKKQSVYSEKMVFRILILFTIIFAIMSIPLYYLVGIEDTETCNFTGESTGNTVWTTIYMILISCTLFSIFSIRKVKDNFFLRNELILLTIIQIAYGIVFSISENMENINMLFYSTVVFDISVSLVYMIIPIFLSYKKEKHQKKILHNKNHSEISNDKNNSYQQFINILNNNDSVKYWIEWSKLNYSIENISFYQFVRNFEMTKKAKRRKKISKQIFNTFIKDGSPLQINISYETRSEITQSFENDDKNIDLFANAKQDILDLMFTNSFPFFIQSNSFYEMKINTPQVDIESFIHIEKPKKDGNSESDSDGNHNSKSSIKNRLVDKNENIELSSKSASGSSSSSEKEKENVREDNDDNQNEKSNETDSRSSSDTDNSDDEKNNSTHSTPSSSLGSSSD
ncbi:double hit isoform b [Anaeramoeba flamelloides]|uniref:Double hit isoform b n=1 Tax=Anaeramoeba flamelloides TaxID=1746091 RepID=A0AAV8A5T7_9EUKA|nr:double hit isoform b [Anaeramoeba flamelloides]